MNIPVVILGATGRMGATLVRMVEEDPLLLLAGVTEREEKLSKTKDLGCLASTNVEELLAKIPSATVVDFTAPEVSLAVATSCKKFSAKHIIGTTGFTEEQKKSLEVLAKDVPLFWSPNMSVGINVLLRILPELTKLLGDDYDAEMVELHHNKKKDSPSGTALRLAECLAEAKGWDLEETACYHREGIIGERPHKEIGVQTIRGGDVVGVHTTYFMGPGERIEVTHQAHSRDNFAGGALRAVKWIQDKPASKLYSMQDVLL